MGSFCFLFLLPDPQVLPHSPPSLRLTMFMYTPFMYVYMSILSVSYMCLYVYVCLAHICVFTFIMVYIYFLSMTRVSGGSLSFWQTKFYLSCPVLLGSFSYCWMIFDLLSLPAAVSICPSFLPLLSSWALGVGSWRGSVGLPVGGWSFLFTAVCSPCATP